jgi:hypothetical protein
VRDVTTSRLMSQQRSNKRAGHFALVVPCDNPKARRRRGDGASQFVSMS